MGMKGFGINIILAVGLVFSIFGLYWMSRLNLPAGESYLWLFIIGVVFISVAVLFKLKGTNFWLEIPISRTPERGLLMLIGGMGFMGLFVIVSTLTRLQFYSPFLMAPLAFSNSLSLGAETFAALQAATSPFWTFFVSVISASVMEELVLGFAFVAMGSLLLGFGLRRLLKLDFGERGNYIWDFIMAMFFSMMCFSILHFFNGSYLNIDGSWNLSMFGYAALFRLVLNILIYRFGHTGLLFAIGVHAVNNAVFLGGDVVWRALASFPGGIILDVIFLILIIFF